MRIAYGYIELDVSKISDNEELIEANIAALKHYMNNTVYEKKPAMFVHHYNNDAWLFFIQPVLALEKYPETKWEMDKYFFLEHPFINSPAQYTLEDLEAPFLDDNISYEFMQTDEQTLVEAALLAYEETEETERQRWLDEYFNPLHAISGGHKIELVRKLLSIDSLKLVEAQRQEQVPEVLHKLEKLAGLIEFKEYMRELEATRPFLSRWKGRPEFPTQHLLFSVDPGNGCSTAASILHEYLKTTGLYGKNADDWDSGIELQEMKFIHYPDDGNLNMTLAREYMDKFMIDFKCSGPNIIVLDIRDWLNHLESIFLTELLEVCWQNRATTVYVFVVPYLDEGVLGRVHARLDAVLNVRVIRFHPYSDEDLIGATKEYLNGYGIGWDNSSDPYYKHILAEERGDRRFYGMQTMNRLGTELVLMKARHTSLKLNEAPPETITGVDFETAFPFEDEQQSGYDMLDKLIGLDDVKQRVRELAVSMKAEKEMVLKGKDATPPCLHMCFTGNPGTGKTTIARIIGKIYREQGILPIGDLLEVNRFDLCGEYIGQTGPKTIDKCRNAMGSVLFIDEAYLLAAGHGYDGDGRDYGKEAVGALVAEMENNRDKFMVIMAGYEDDMELLFKLNSGLRGRIPHNLHFPNYSRSELFEIFKMQTADRYSYDNEVSEAVHKFFEQLDEKFMESKEFGNARFVRNLIERIRIKALMRMQGESLPEDGRLPVLVTDFESAVGDEDMSGINKKEARRRIGFATDSGQVWSMRGI